MPVLNRIRIANVSYDHKFIVDELYDTFGGANTLLNLANGSGKSVLVQMMLQPILPCKRIHGRRIESYLTRGGAPTYLLLEWQLDRTTRPTYFLTGIVMGFSRPSESDDVAQVKYFTFTHRYTEGNPLDIRQIPLVRHNAGENGKGVVYLSYEEARQFVQAQAQEHVDFRTFGKDKLKEYHTVLRQHGIFSEEWELLASINEKEGGVDELFASCKTSDVLMDRWILTMVSGGLSAGRGELLEMFEALMTAILEEENSLQDKERIELFLEQLEPLRTQMEALCGDLDQKERIEAQLTGLYHHLEAALIRLREEKRTLEEQAGQVEEEEGHIRWEELSKQYHERREDCETLMDQLESARLLCSEQEIACQRAERLFRALQAAEYYGDMVRAAQRVRSLEEQILVFREGKEQEDLRNVAFTLSTKYGETAAAYRARRNEVGARLEQGRTRLNALKAEREELQKQMEALSAEQAALGERLSHFRAEEAAVLGQLGLALNRNMLGELDLRETQEADRRMNDWLAQLERQQETLLRELDDAQTRIRELRAEQEAALRRQVDLTARLQQAQQKVEAWKEAEGALRAALAKYLPTSDLYDKAGLSAFLLRLRETWQAEEDRLVRRRDRLQSRLTNFLRGSLHTDLSFYEALEAAGVHTVTGETYLKSSHLKEEQQREILRRNPLFPYCFLIARSDLKRAQEVACQEPIERVCPIMALEDADLALKADGRTVFPEESVRLVCRYDWESMGAELCQGYGDRLSDELDHAEQACADQRGRLIALSRDLELLNAFPYARGDGPALEQAAADLEAERVEEDSRISACFEEEKRQATLAREKRAAAEQCADEMQKADAQRGIFARYLKQNAAFEADFKAMRRVNEERGAVLRRRAGSEAEYDETDRDCQELDHELHEVNTLERALMEKNRDLTAPDTGVLLDLDIPALEERHQTLAGQLDRDERHLNAAKAHAGKERDEAESRLKKRFSDIPREDYAELAFDEEELERRGRRLKRCQAELSDKKQTVTRGETESRVAKERLKEAEEQLRGAGREEPLPPREVKGNFAQRRAACAERRSELKRLEAENQVLRQEHEARQNSLLRIIDPKSHAPAGSPPKEGYDKLDLTALDQAYSGLKARINSGNRGLERGLAELKRTFRGSAPTIDNVLCGLQLEDAPLAFKPYYFQFERLSDLLVKLRDYLEILNSTLQRVETQKENVVRQAASQGRNLYRELCKINSSTSIRLNGSSTAQPTLHIGIPESLDGQHEERMRNYVSLSISTARELLSAGELTKEKMRRYLEDRFSDRQLLNTVIGQTNIPIKLYKVESIPQNSRLKAWENIVVENSGGELFVSCFILISALISYSRRRKLALQNASEGSKIFLIDNPFGKASSPHLLEAMIKVAKKFDTQLICLSDLSQSSITQQFDLIYQLSMRKAAYSNRSYLKTDEVKNNADLHVDGRLEHISAYWEQMSLL